MNPYAFRSRLPAALRITCVAVLGASSSSAQFPYSLGDVLLDGSANETRTIEDWGGLAVFPGNTAAEGVEPWISDGTPGGTRILLDIHVGTGNSVSTRSLFSVEWNGFHYFAANDGVHGTELWRSDGTTTGTSMFMEFEPGVGGSSPTLKIVNGKLVIAAFSSATGSELWVSDGTVAGTQLLLDIGPGAASGLFYIPPTIPVDVFGNLGLFGADDGVHGFEPWVTDGTTAGTFMLADIFPGPGSSSTGFLGPVSSSLMLFRSNDGVNGRELWRTDGTSSGTQLVLDINPGAAFSNPSRTFVPAITAGLLFTATTASQGTELWVSDGTTAGTYLVREFEPGIAGPQLLVRKLNATHAILGASSPATGFEPWITDGTPSGTVAVEITPGPAGGTYFTNQLYYSVQGRVFVMTDTPGLGQEVGVTDGTPAGTYVVKDLVPGGGGISGPFTVCDGFVFFNVGGGVGYSDGFASTTRVLQGAPGQAASLRIWQAKRIGGFVFMIGNDVVNYTGIKMYAMRVDIDADGTIDLFDDLAFGTGCSCTATVAPCANPSPTNGCANSTGSGARIDAVGSTILSNDDLVLIVSQLPPSTLGILFMGATHGAPTPFRDGIRCVSGSVARWPVHAATPAGTMSYGPGLAAQASATFAPAFHMRPATTWNFQAWYRDNGGPCGSGSNLSSSGTVVFRP